MAYFTYILVTESLDRIYIGQTNDLQRRLERHNSGYVKSTKLHGPWKFLFHCKQPNRSQAMKVERKLKNLKSRKRLLGWILNYSDQNDTAFLAAFFDQINNASS